MIVFFETGKNLNISFGKNLSVLLLFLLCSFRVDAQQPITKESINKNLEKANQFVHSENPEKAIPILEKVIKDCKIIDYKSGMTRAGYTFAIIYFNSSDYNKVINLNEDFLKVGNETKDYENVSHIHRLKGCAYSELGLLSKGNEEFEQALQYAEKINPGNNRQYALSLIYSNLSSHLMKGSAPKDSIFTNVKKCIAEAEKMDENSDANISRKYSLIAYSYIIMANLNEQDGKLDLAEDYYLKSLHIHHTKSVPLVERVVLLNQLAYFYYEKKDYKESVKYSEEGIATEKKASIPQLRRDLYEILSKSYMELHETEKSKQYLRLFTELNDSISSINKKAVDAALNKTISKQEELRLNNSSKQTIIYTLSAIVFLILGIFLFLYYKKQMQIKKIEKVLEKLKAKQNNQETLLPTNPAILKVEEKDEKTALMSPESEQKLLEKLQEFEKNQLFLERKVSLPYVAAEIETNTKYLSYIIKKHKEKDFNEYINDLRINYIVQKITDDPIYRQYKINTLAEETGFSSHSKFATVFKATIGVSPSEFIKYFQQK